MKHKILFVLVAMLSVATSGWSQHQAFYTQYVMNPFISNPALAGIENYWDMRLSYRHQWQGIEGAPRTNYFTIHGSFKKLIYAKPTTATVPVVDPRNPRKASYVQKYKPIVPHAGFGLVYYNDQTGPLNRYVVKANYAYHIGLTRRTSISAGIAGGFQSIALNVDKLNFGSANPSDPSLVSSGMVNYFKPDISAGLWLYSAFYFVGASLQNVVSLKTGYGEAVDNQIVPPHFTASAGYKFLLSDKVNLLPSTMVRFESPAPVNFDVNLKVQYQDRMWAGISYRRMNTFAAMIGMNVNSYFNFSYSYDMTSSAIGNVSQGTHEVLIGILLSNRNRVFCPQDFW